MSACARCGYPEPEKHIRASTGTPRTDWTTDDRKEAIEGMIDAAGASNALGAIAEVCRAKAEHLRHSWQEEGRARVWEKVGRAADNAAMTAANFAV